MDRITIRERTHKPLPVSRPRVAASLSSGQISPILQRQSGCACGGGCPRCDAKSHPPDIQTKLTVSAGDRFEQEADSIAEQVMRMPESTLRRSSTLWPARDSSCPQCHKESEKFIQRSATPTVEPSGARVAGNPLSDLGPGQSLDVTARSFFEPRFGCVFGEVRIHTDRRAGDSARAISALAYTVGNDIVFGESQYAPETQAGKKLLAHELTHTLQQSGLRSGRAMLQRKPDDKKEKDEPKKPPPPKPAVTACPTFVSLTATINTPKVSDSCKSGNCRLELGCCTTARGSCGNTKDSGAAFKGTIDVPSDCTGELGFMQNLVSTDRKRTMSDKSKECVKADTAHADGGVPWKGCKVAVTGAGTYSIESDDCPFLGLDDKMVAASVAESFKTFLLWKVTGGSWKPIGMVSWSWSAATTQKKGTDCASKWTAPGGSGSTATGSASTDKPVSSPSVQDVLDHWGPCEEKKEK
jgi:uncharacterized protein DUF4157